MCPAGRGITRLVRTDLFDYDLPEPRIARWPSPRRDESRLLVVEERGVCHARITDWPELVPVLLACRLGLYHIRRYNRSRASRTSGSALSAAWSSGSESCRRDDDLSG